MLFITPIKGPRKPLRLELSDAERKRCVAGETFLGSSMSIDVFFGAWVEKFLRGISIFESLI